ncbi:MAG: NAD(P)-dependent oxidoreductase [Bacteroidales bacterium]|jgi:nucleoside-diphosphate-sugar epimerase|nr:NAD(P)-dependent oxidoreductase [Bacteroidales bacterium]
MSKIIVTGSSGFVGKHLVSSLKESGLQVVEVDYNNGHDLTNPACLNFVSDFDYIVHLASRSFVPESFENPFIFYRDNYLMTLNVLEAARKAEAQVIFFSSYLYGPPEYLPIDENHQLAPHNPYAQTKLICEKLCEGYNRDFGLDIVVFRPFNIYGKGQNESFLIPSIIKQAKLGTIKLKDPRPKRDFIHVLDVVSAVKKVIYLQPKGYLVFNLGSGKSYAIQEVTKFVSDVIDKELIIEFTNEYRQGEVLDTVANINKAITLLGWNTDIEIIDGLFTLLSPPK